MTPIDRDAALEQLLATSTFAGAARSQALLRFLARRAWTEGDTHVNETVIALDHLGRDARTFDPKADSVVRVELSRLRKRLETCCSGDLGDAPWRISLPSGSYVPVFSLRDGSSAVSPVSPQAVTFSADDAKPDADAKPLLPAPPSPSPSVSSAALVPRQQRGWRRMSRLTLALAIATVCAIAGWTLWRTTKDYVDPGDVIAVLPFTCGTEASEDLFCDGLADELLDKLVQVPALKVIARTSSFKFKGRNIDAREAGQQLGAKYLVEGSLQREGDAYKLVAQMVRASDGVHVVSRLFRRSASDRLQLQSDLAGLMADALAQNLRPIFAASQSDREQLSTEALEKWNRAGRLSLRGSKDDHEKAGHLVDEVLTAHPSFARGWATKASFARDSHYFGVPLDVAAATALPLQRKAASMAPNDAGIQASLAAIEYLNGADVRVTYAHLKELAEKNPNHPTVLYWLGTVLWLTGRLQEAADAYRASQVLSPLSTYPLHMRAQMLLFMGGSDNLAEALRLVQRALAMEPGFTDLYRVRGAIRVLQGNYAAAKPDIERGLVPFGGMHQSYSAAYFKFMESRNAVAAVRFDVVAARAAIAAQYGPSAMPFASLSAASTGHTEEAIVWAERAIKEGQAGTAYMATTMHCSWFLPFRNDPRMQAVYERIGSSWARAPISSPTASR